MKLKLIFYNIGEKNPTLTAHVEKQKKLVAFKNMGPEMYR